MPIEKWHSNICQTCWTSKEAPGFSGRSPSSLRSLHYGHPKSPARIAGVSYLRIRGWKGRDSQQWKQVSCFHSPRQSFPLFAQRLMLQDGSAGKKKKTPTTAGQNNMKLFLIGLQCDWKPLQLSQLHWPLRAALPAHPSPNM